MNHTSLTSAVQSTSGGSGSSISHSSQTVTEVEAPDLLDEDKFILIARAEAGHDLPDSESQTYRAYSQVMSCQSMVRMPRPSRGLGEVRLQRVALLTTGISGQQFGEALTKAIGLECGLSPGKLRRWWTAVKDSKATADCIQREADQSRDRCTDIRLHGSEHGLEGYDRFAE
jgi:hypothetical protein